MIPEWVLRILVVIISIMASSIFFCISKKLFYHALWIGFSTMVIFLLVITLYIRNDLIQKEIESKKPIYFGELVPDNEVSPPLPPSVPDNTVSLLLGDNLRVLAAQSENYIFSKNGKTFLSIGIKNGLMSVSLDIMDNRNKNIVRIINNEFKVDPGNAFNPKQPDKHSLVVRDSEGIEVLNVRFINPKTIRIVGRFHVPGCNEPILILPDKGIQWPEGGGIVNLTVNMTESKGGFIAFK